MVQPDLKRDGFFLGDELHADGAQAGFRHMTECFQDATGIGAVPLEERAMQAGGFVNLDMKNLSGGAAEHGRCLAVDFGERGGRRREIGDRGLRIGRGRGCAFTHDSRSEGEHRFSGFGVGGIHPPPSEAFDGAEGEEDGQDGEERAHGMRDVRAEFATGKGRLPAFGTYF